MTAPAERDLHVPEVSTSTAGTVVVELSPKHAHVLALLLAHYDAIVTWRGPKGQQVSVVDEYDGPIWHHTLIQLRANADAAVEQTAPVLPFRRPGTPTTGDPS